MKKPKYMTKGRWYAASDGLIVTKDADGTEILIADIDYMGDDKSECEANRKAIAQVPNMIDELIGVIEAIEYFKSTGSDTPLLKSKNRIEQVLLDAGCTP